MLALALLLAAPQAPDASIPAPAAERQRPGLWIADTAFSPADIASARQQWHDRAAMPIVVITFTEAGRLKFRRVQEGRVGQPLEIRVDGGLIASPILMEIVTGDSISIAGSYTRDEAIALAIRIAPPR